eukprot:gene4808-34562_t
MPDSSPWRASWRRSLESLPPRLTWDLYALVMKSQYNAHAFASHIALHPKHCAEMLNLVTMPRAACLKSFSPIHCALPSTRVCRKPVGAPLLRSQQAARQVGSVVARGQKADDERFYQELSKEIDSKSVWDSEIVAGLFRFLSISLLVAATIGLTYIATPVSAGGRGYKGGGGQADRQVWAGDKESGRAMERDRDRMITQTIEAFPVNNLDDVEEMSLTP